MPLNRLSLSAFEGKEPSNQNYFQITKMRLTKVEMICYCGSITLGKMKTRKLELNAWLSLLLVVSEFGHIACALWAKASLSINLKAVNAYHTMLWWWSNEIIYRWQCPINISLSLQFRSQDSSSLTIPETMWDFFLFPLTLTLSYEYRKVNMLAG